MDGRRSVKATSVMAQNSPRLPVYQWDVSVAAASARGRRKGLETVYQPGMRAGREVKCAGVRKVAGHHKTFILY